MPIIIVLFNISGLVIATFILTKIGRRTLLLCGNGAVSVINIVIGLLFVFQGWAYSGAIVVVLMCLFMLIFGISIGSIFWMFVPMMVASKRAPLVTAVHWFAQAICIFLIPLGRKLNNNNLGAVFFILGAIMLICFTLNYIFLIEINGKTRKDIQQEYLNRTNKTD